MPNPKSKKRRNSLSDLFEIERETTSSDIAQEENATEPEQEKLIPIEPLKKMEPGKTQIGVVEVEINGNSKVFVVYYGNYIKTTINQTRFRLKKKEYIYLLEEFLKSEDGKEYINPSEKERANAVKQIGDFLNEEQKKSGYGSILIYPGQTNIEVAEPVNMDADKDKGGQPQSNSNGEIIIDPHAEKRINAIAQRKLNNEKLEKTIAEVKADRKKSRITTLTIVLAVLLVLGVVLYLIRDVLFGSMLQIELRLTDEEIIVNLGEPFVAQSYVEYVTDNNKVYIIYPSLDTNRLGEYELEYVATNNYSSNKQKLLVKVVDKTAPVIKLTDEEIKLVRGVDEDTFDLMNYIDSIGDNADEEKDLKVIHTIFDWSRNEQVVTYQVIDASGNSSVAQLKINIEDKAECVNNATYDPETNTCSCNEGYEGEGTQGCKLIPKKQSSSSSGSSSASSSGGGSSSSGSSTAGTTPPVTPNDPPAPRGFSRVGSGTFSVGTDLDTIMRYIIAGTTCSDSYSVSCTSVNNTIAGSYSCTLTSSAGDSVSAPVTITN